MNLIEITNLDIPSLQIYRHIRDNVVTKDNSFIADSPKVVKLLLESGVEVKSILATKKFYIENTDLIKSRDIPLLYVASKSVMKEIVGHNVHHGVMMHGIRPALTPIEQMDDSIIMLDSIGKNDNVGAVARSAAAMEVGSMLVSIKSPHPFGRKALRVSMGYASRLKIDIYDDIFATIAKLKQLDYKIFAAEITEGSTPLQQVKIPKKWVLLMGDEHTGILPEILDACDEVVTIEMSPSVASFNVAHASSIIMYQFKNRA